MRSNRTKPLVTDEIYQYLALLTHYWWLIIGLTVLGGVVAAGATSLQHREYVASTTLVLNPAVPNQGIPYLGATVSNNNQQTPTQQLADSYSIYLQTHFFDDLVIHRMELGNQISAGDLGSRVSSSLVNNTNFFTISVKWTNPVQAARLANGIANLFIEANAPTQQKNGRQPSTPLQQALSFYSKQIKEAQSEHDAVQNDPTISVQAKQQQLTTIEDRLSTLEDTYIRLLGQSSSTQDTNTARIIDSALPPTSPTSPSIRRNVLYGLVAGFAIAFCLVIFLNYLDSTRITFGHVFPEADAELEAAPWEDDIRTAVRRRSANE